MNTRFRLLAVGLALTLTCAAPIATAAKEPLKAGVAAIDITPPVGHRMAGYFGERMATGTRDPLHAKALVLQQGGTKAAIVACDLVGVSLNVSSKARARASELTGIPAAHILIAATHSHTGPLFDDVRADFFHERAVARHGEDPHRTLDYPEWLVGRVVSAIQKADAALKPAELAAGIGRQEGLSFNRRYHMKNGSVAFNPGQLNPNILRPAGPIDPDVGIVRVSDPQGLDTPAVLTVFALHLDTLGGTEHSADYPYFLEQGLRRHAGTNLVSLFAAGTCGDINHIDVSHKDTRKGIVLTEHIGTTLADTVISALDALTPIHNPALACRNRTLNIPLQEVTPEQVAGARRKIEAIDDSSIGFMAKVQAVKTLDLAAKGRSLPMEVQVFRLDSDTALVGLPGEIFVELGLAIKDASPFCKTLVMSICNDRPGYVPTKKAFAEGSYEVVNSRIKPGGGELLVETAIELLNDLKTR